MVIPYVVKLEVDYDEDDLFVFLQAVWLFGLMQFNFYPLELKFSFSVSNTLLFKKTVTIRTRLEKRKRVKKKKEKKRLLQPEFIKRAAKKIFHDLHPRFYVFLKIGFETPILTGFLFPVAHLLRRAAGNRFELYPDFSSDTIALKSFFIARIFILQVLITGVQLFFIKKEIKNG